MEDIKKANIDFDELKSDTEINDALKKAFGALSTEEERREGKKVVITYMRDNHLSSLDFEDPETGVVKHARFFDERKTIAFSQKKLKELYPDVYKACLTEQVKPANVWIAKGKKKGGK
jgi:hypothetical protein